MMRVAEAAYSVYSESAGRGHHMPVPEFAGLPKVEKVKWERVAQAVLQQWLETDFRAAVNDDERIEVNAGRMVAVGQRRGDPAFKIFRTAITAFVWDVIMPGEIERQMAEAARVASTDTEQDEAS